uniref:CSON010484 protein n=1 Tax=Culicoides sonorensis TaxID=179676 RepID=A0A336LFI7_CULSO
MTYLGSICILFLHTFSLSWQLPVFETSENHSNDLQQQSQIPTSTWIGSPELELIIDSDRYVLTVIANKIHESQLPMHLRSAAIEVFNKAQDSLRTCELEFVETHRQIWIFKSCIADLLKKSIMLLDTIGQNGIIPSTEDALVDLDQFKLR